MRKIRRDLVDNNKLIFFSKTLNFLCEIIYLTWYFSVFILSMSFDKCFLIENSHLFLCNGQNILSGRSFEVFVGGVLVSVDLHVGHVFLLGRCRGIHFDETLEKKKFNGEKNQL